MLSPQQIYDRSPYWAQRALLNAHALRIHRERYGSKFLETMDVLRETQWYSSQQIADYQFTRLEKLLQHAYNTVPFYRALYDAHGVHPSQFRAIDDIQRFPLIDKEAVREAGASIISSTVTKRSLSKGGTSGTTGSPLSLYWDKATCVLTAAVDWRQKEWGGIHYGDKIALFLGRPIVSTGRMKPPFWQYDHLHKMLWMSSFHLSEQHVPSYIRKLAEFKPAAVEGYPSTLFIIARFLEQFGKRVPVKAVFSSSEPLLPPQRRLIEDRFQAPVFDFYGLAERIAFATQCADHQSHHLNFEYALNEIVDHAGNPVPDGAMGHLVGTSLSNFGMPLIRYRTSDVTAVKPGHCDCGRAMKVLAEVATKQEDILVTPDGKMVSPSILTHAFKPLTSILESQIIQEDLNHVRVRLVRLKEVDAEQEAHLRSSLHARLGQDVSIELEYVERIERTSNGKFRWVISKVPFPT